MPPKREDLLKAAKKLLWERGYEATSPRDIQEASGAGQGSFYHHFNGKLDLAATALEEVSAEMQELATAPQKDLPILNWLGINQSEPL